MHLYRVAGKTSRWAARSGAYLQLFQPDANLDEICARDVHPTTESLALDDATLCPPVETPGKIVCVGVNYLDHCRETGTEPPDQPLLFAKFPSIISGPNATVAWDEEVTQQVDYEAELVVTIGDRAEGVSVKSALDHVRGYMCGNDLSARDLQLGDGQWIRGKNLSGFCGLGPCLVTADEVPNPQELAIECKVNGSVMQASNTSEMIFGVAEIISYCSRHFTLEAGDIIMTGTPDGVALGRDPSPWLRNGDVVTVTVAGIGTLTTHCRTPGQKEAEDGPNISDPRSSPSPGRP